MKIGAHLSTAGGFTNPLQKIVEIGGNCLQIFSSSPRNWGVLPVTDEQVTSFIEMKSTLGIDPVYFHASYLINLANPGRGGSISVKTLIDELSLAERMGIRGTIIHLGSFNGEGNTYDVLIKNIAQVLEHAPQNISVTGAMIPIPPGSPSAKRYFHDVSLPRDASFNSSG